MIDKLNVTADQKAKLDPILDVVTPEAEVRDPPRKEIVKGEPQPVTGGPSAGRTTLDEATIAIRKTHEGSAPLLDGANTTITQVNTQLERVDGITSNACAVSW